MEPASVAADDEDVIVDSQFNHNTQQRENKMLLDSDHGHRYGNFPNYSTFHPPHARLQVLQYSGILHHIRRGIIQPQQLGGGVHFKALAGGLQSTSKSIRNENDDDDGDDDDINIEKNKTKGHKRPKMTNNTELADFAPALSPSPNKCDNSIIIYYCDLGCNSGELTVALAASLFHLDDSGTTDVEKEEDEEKHPMVAVNILGVDLDPTLVKRANASFSTFADSSTVSGSSIPYPPTRSDEDNNNNNRDNPTCDAENGKLEEVVAPVIASNMMGAKNRMKATFMACDLNSDTEHNAACASFLANACGIRVEDGTAKEERGGVSAHYDGKQQPMATASRARTSPPTPQLPCRQLFHLTTIFSTTMWIHVHGGDDGLRSFIERACHWTSKFLLVEPQHSGCYRKANIRLRKMNRPELDDVTSNRLTMRPEIEKEIECIILRCGFRRIVPKCTADKKEVKDDAITSWNRSLRLYERVHNN